MCQEIPAEGWWGGMGVEEGKAERGESTVRGRGAEGDKRVSNEKAMIAFLSLQMTVITSMTCCRQSPSRNDTPRHNVT